MFFDVGGGNGERRGKMAVDPGFRHRVALPGDFNNNLFAAFIVSNQQVQSPSKICLGVCAGAQFELPFQDRLENGPSCNTVFRFVNPAMQRYVPGIVLVIKKCCGTKKEQSLVGFDVRIFGFLAA